jgi:heat shock protein HtpX
MIGAAIGATLIQLAISRQREYKADEVGARTIKDPTALKNALIKLDDYNKRWPIERGNPASASLFIVNPFRSGGLIRLFSTHPPMEKRIKRLEKLEQELMFAPKTMAVESSIEGIGSPYRVK